MDMGVMLAATAETAVLVAYFMPREIRSRQRKIRRYVTGKVARR